MQSFTDFDIFRAGQSEYITIFVRDPTNAQLADVVGNSTFNLISMADDSTIATATFGPSGSNTVVRQSTGVYQVLFDSSVLTLEYLAAFRCVMAADILQQNVFVKSVTARHFKYAAALRNQIDKARKSVIDYVANIDRERKASIQLFFGYDDKHLIFYLERGVQLINLVPPYTGLAVDTFPFDQFGSLLIDAATIAALEAQGIFAIDTDYDYSLGGNSMVIEHFSKLSSATASILARFQDNVTKLKNLFLTKGLVLYQFSPGGVRDMRYLTALPSGFWSRILSNEMQSSV